MNTPVNADGTSTSPPTSYVSVVLGVFALLVAGAAWFSRGSVDPLPIQADIADLKSQVSQLQSHLSVSETAPTEAEKTARAALLAAQASQSAVDATNEKIDRMFARSRQ